MPDGNYEVQPHEPSVHQVLGESFKVQDSRTHSVYNPSGKELLTDLTWALCGLGVSFFIGFWFSGIVN